MDKNIRKEITCSKKTAKSTETIPTYRRSHTQTHTPKKKMDPINLQSVEPARGTCPASCGHTDSNHHSGTQTHDPKSTTTTICRALVDNHSLALDARLEMSELKCPFPEEMSHTR